MPTRTSTTVRGGSSARAIFEKKNDPPQRSERRPSSPQSDKRMPWGLDNGWNLVTVHGGPPEGRIRPAWTFHLLLPASIAIPKQPRGEGGIDPNLALKGEPAA